MKHLECTTGGHNKFWKIWTIGNGVTVKTKFGQIGTDGTTVVKDFDYRYQAQTYINQKVEEKINKGYVVINDYTKKETMNIKLLNNFTAEVNTSELLTKPTQLAVWGNKAYIPSKISIGVSNGKISSFPFGLCSLDVESLRNVSNFLDKLADQIESVG